MVEISVIMSSARDDYPIIEMPDLHMLQPTIESLKNQSFKDFEFILCDALYNYRSKLFEGRPFDKDKLGFVVKHIPVEHNPMFNHAFWLGHRRWAVCGQLNTCLIHANGSLIVRVDDCSEFDSSYLRKFWDTYQTGLWANAMHVKWLGGKPAYLNDEYRKKGYESSTSINYGYKNYFDLNRDEILRKIYGENGLIRDTRYEIVKKEGGRKIGFPEWFYGYSSFTLDAALKINGFSENMDGDKSLEDSDFGSRLTMAGYENKFLLDIDLQVIEHEHGPVSNKVIDSGSKNIKCNYAIYLINRKRNRWKANSSILSEKDIEFIRSESLKHPCSPTPNFYDDNCKGKMFNIWTRNQPVFDLKEERKLYGE